MWPYDYFNQFSGLINEFLTESRDGVPKKKVFFAKWLGNDKNDAEGQEKKIREFIESESIDIISDLKPKIEDALRYQLEAIIPRFKKGDINIEILGGIIESFIVICDITPINLKDIIEGLKKGKEVDPTFNPNVMIELGLALAWKMPEQVIAVYDKEWSFEKLTRKLPFDIQSYFVQKIDYANLDSKEYNLRKSIQDRIKLVDLNKSIIMKNIKIKLDHDSLTILKRRNGLMFGPEYLSRDSFYYHRELDTIRNLLKLGLFRTEIFPNGRDYGYCLTDLGRIFLKKELKSETMLFPKVFCEFMRVSFWRGYNREEYKDKEGKTAFENKKNNFYQEFSIPWDDADKALKEILIQQEISESEQVITMYDEYARSRNATFSDIWEKIAFPWSQKIGRLKGENS
ncbi:MAG: hypothetical protein KKE64_02985 [Candidatus Omnitrophica bacterium]|nr:hypothetical protein [Candidatus Omnitrophota bacterium]